MKHLALILLSLVIFSSCKKDKDERNENQYNVLFVTPKNERIYIGTVKGISSCKYTASSYYSHRRWIGQGWDYVCCLRTKEDECAEEHRYQDK